MKPHEETWTVVGCGTPAHGPEWHCWTVKDASGKAVLHSVSKATAQRYAAFPAMARALLEVHYGRGSDEYRARVVASALKEAGVLG